jgi:hypothetical protein
MGVVNEIIYKEELEFQEELRLGNGIHTSVLPGVMLKIMDIKDDPNGFNYGTIWASDGKREKWYKIALDEIDSVSVISYPVDWPPSRGLRDDLRDLSQAMCLARLAELTPQLPLFIGNRHERRKAMAMFRKNNS